MICFTYNIKKVSAYWNDHGMLRSPQRHDGKYKQRQQELGLRFDYNIGLLVRTPYSRYDYRSVQYVNTLKNSNKDLI